MNNEYFLGLDIGTNSCGFAVTDTNYNILKKGSKQMWGVRLFDEAETAKNRRLFRAARRRLDRKKLKIEWLNQIFAPYINAVDPNMLTRIKFSALWEEDKKLMNTGLCTKDSLFGGNTTIDGKRYTDKDYYNDYPTIFHLRKELLSTPARDVRFLYLAIHHIIKNRGHFLFAGDLEASGSVLDAINSLRAYAEQMSDDCFVLGCGNVVRRTTCDQALEEEILRVLNAKLGVRDTKNKFYALFNCTTEASKNFMAALVTGKNVKLDKFLNISAEEKPSISFDSDDYEEKLAELGNVLNDEQLGLVEQLKNAYSVLQLRKILDKNEFICESMVDLFNKHHEQLGRFKSFIAKYYPQHKNDMFKKTDFSGMNKGFVNYAVYVGGGISCGTKQVVITKGTDRSQELFYKYVNSILEQAPTVENEEFLALKEEFKTAIENGDFLPKLRTKNNAVLPNQLYENELKKCLAVNAKKFSWLNQVDETGLSAADKIVAILKFRIPYFVGPLGNNLSVTNTHWSERTSNLPLTPWTLEKIVDFDACEDKFIQKMTNFCTYLRGEKVLPKHSMLFAKFRVLNDLNNLTVNGNPISVQLKQDIFHDLFEKTKRVTKKALRDYLVAKNVVGKNEDCTFGGIDQDFKNFLNCFVELNNCGLFDPEFIAENEKIFEEIIEWHTIISDKDRLMKRVVKNFPNKFSQEQLRFIKALNFADWGSLSGRFLTGLKFVNKQTGEVTNVLGELWNTNQNLQKILFNTNYTLEEELSNANKHAEKGLEYEAVANSYCSPAVKRGVWQSLKVIKEIVDIMGQKPSKIFIEVTRTDEKKGEEGRKLSRKTNLLNTYGSKNFQTVVEGLNIELSTLLNQLNHAENNALRSEKLFLYFMQLGKCAYSGEIINIEDLYDDNLYDVDHIVPQSKFKDDSINNKVLVKKKFNADKADYYPIASRFPEWIAKQKMFWTHLKQLGLMTDSKYNKLVRTDAVTDEELGEFVNRQLVHTNQTSKVVIDLLKEFVGEETKVVYSKANVVSDFRKQFKILKSREVNDLHHAKDAFLNIVVGNVVHCRFTENPRNFYKSKENKNSHLSTNIMRIFEEERDVYSQNGAVVWNKKRDLEKVKQICSGNFCMVSRMSFSTQNGEFYNQTVYKSLKNNPKSRAKIAIKASSNPLGNFEKYGGYDSANNGYFMLIEGQNKQGQTRKIVEAVPVYLCQQLKHLSDQEKNAKILEFVSLENQLTNVKVLMPKLNYKSTLAIGKGEFWLAATSDKRLGLHNANQWYASDKIVEYVKALTKYQDLKNQKKDQFLKEENGKVILSPAKNDKVAEIALTKQQNQWLCAEIIKQLAKPCYAGTNMANAGKTLESCLDKFEALGVLAQATVLLSAVAFLSTGKNLLNLSLLGQGSMLGSMLIKKDITGQDIYLIIRSATGLKEKRIKL